MAAKAACDLPVLMLPHPVAVAPDVDDNGAGAGRARSGTPSAAPGQRCSRLHDVTPHAISDNVLAAVEESP